MWVYVCEYAYLSRCLPSCLTLRRLQSTEPKFSCDRVYKVCAAMSSEQSNFHGSPETTLGAITDCCSAEQMQAQGELITELAVLYTVASRAARPGRHPLRHPWKERL